MATVEGPADACHVSNGSDPDIPALGAQGRLHPQHQALGIGGFEMLDWPFSRAAQVGFFF